MREKLKKVATKTTKASRSHFQEGSFWFLRIYPNFTAPSFQGSLQQINISSQSSTYENKYLAVAEIEIAQQQKRKRKLEQQEEKHQDKVLSLDPPHIYHLYYQNQTQNHQVQGGGGGGGEEESQNTASHEYQLFQHHHQLESTHPQSQPPAALEHARLRGNMRETTHHLHQTSSRNSGGEIVQVQGGHVLRSIGRKDRHSKVCTSKGPRDRRVRLAANTAIQFYDVQDRLGYDRPSKAVDWLIKKAKASIDELAHLPPWNPAITSASAPDVNFEQQEAQKQLEENLNRQPHGSSTADLNVNNPSFLSPSMDSDAIEDTIKSFFPMGGSDEASSSDMHFQSFPSSDLLSRTSSQSQDLRLTLQSFQDPILLHHHNKQPQRYQSPSHHTDQQAHLQAQVLFTETTPLPLGFGNTGWSEHHQQPCWNVSGDSASGGFLFNLPPAAQPLGQNHFFSQRGPLQSSNTPSFSAWMDPSAITIATSDHSQHYHHHPELESIYTTSISGVGFTSGISGFHFPARIPGDEEEHDGYSDKPSSASSDSRH